MFVVDSSVAKCYTEDEIVRLHNSPGMTQWVSSKLVGMGASLMVAEKKELKDLQER